LIDFQDAVFGPTAYDVASLAQDARVDISLNLEKAIIDAYVNARLAKGNFDQIRFRQDYAIMAAQRATKILGIFIRLNERDGKPAYLAHLPRLRDYIDRSLKHPVLSQYREWFETVISDARPTVTKT
jgi:aminoglycoside/choline kinase family phosphotransferase